jgi:hypothetical protein
MIMRFKVAPLSGTFMLASLFGIFFSVLILSKSSVTWAFTIGFLSLIAFIASVISMTYAPVEDELLIDESFSDRKKRIRIERPLPKTKKKK